MRLVWLRLVAPLAVLVALAPPVPAQRAAGRMPTAAVLWAGPITLAKPYLDAGTEALRELGWVEGQNIAIERRFAPPTAQSQSDRRAALIANAQDLARMKVDVIVAVADPAVEAARSATSEIPIVMLAVGDAVGLGFVSSLARPGGNITGIGALSSELSGKRLELLKQIVPRANRVAVLWNPVNPAGPLGFREIEGTARQLGVTLQSLPVRSESEIPPAFAAMAQERVDGLTVVTDPLTWTTRREIIELANKNRVPAVYELREYVDMGGLASYGPSLIGLSRRVAFFVDKILKGARPATLPAELPTQLELVVNLKTAASLQLTIPQPIAVRANDVVR
jgi:putative tryptophan/tyrosine transport system substrate-binding protein